MSIFAFQHIFPIRSTKRLAAVFSISALALFLLPPSALAAASDQPIFSSTPIKFWLGRTAFQIPRNYFTSPPAMAQYKGNEGLSGHAPEIGGTEFVLRLLLPDFVPQTATNFKAFNSRVGDQITVLVSKKSRFKPADDGLDVSYSKRNGPVSVGPEGFLSFPYAGGKEGFFKGSLQHPKYFTMCDREGFVSYPHCERHVPIAIDMVMHYSVSRRYLSNIPAIDKNLVDMLNNFKIEGTALAVPQ